MCRDTDRHYKLQYKVTKTLAESSLHQKALRTGGSGGPSSATRARGSGEGSGEDRGGYPPGEFGAIFDLPAQPVPPGRRP